MPLNPYTGEWESEPDDVQVPDPALVAREDEWNRASHELNKHKDKFDKDKSINWDAARRVFEAAAGSGKGTFNDWINQTVAADQRKLWLGTAPAAAPAATGGATPAGGKLDPYYQGGGINRQKWDDPTHNTDKYTSLRAISGMRLTPAEVRAQWGTGAGASVDALKALGWEIVSNNQAYKPGVGRVDFIHSENDEFGYRRVSQDRDGKVPWPTDKAPKAPSGLNTPVYSHPGGEFGPTGPIAQPARRLGTGASLVSRDAAMTPWAPVGQSAPRAGNTLFQWDQPNAAPAPQQQNAAAMFDQMFRRFMAGQR